jgi:hypothetical protein
MNLKLIGDYDWVFMRNTMVTALQKCTSEEDLLEIIQGLISGIGTKDMIQAQRKQLGLKPLSKKELKKL